MHYACGHVQLDSHGHEPDPPAAPAPAPAAGDYHPLAAEQLQQIVPSLTPAEPQYAFKSALWYWNTHDGNAVADTGNITKITEMVNGGTTALDVRTQFYNRSLQVLGG